MTPNRKTNGTVEILIAEDSPTQVAQLAHLLERHGYSVTTAANGRQALRVLERRKPTLVITDIVMPELDGYGLCKAIKADDKLRGIPVMLVTTLSDPQDVIRGLECGADNFMRKPYDERHLLSRIEYLLMNLEMRKSQKMQMGMEINLGGQKHFINSERQQILDLLISTYEQAVEINGELKKQGTELTHSNAVLSALYSIAEGLNRAGSEREVAETVLERAMELPGIQAGWISLREGESGFRLAAARNLPPALHAPGAMEGDCTCRRRLIGGALDSVANILECERLGKAGGDTRGLCYHASVPLWLGDRTLGVMNLVGPEKGLFNDDELRILYGVGNQVAVALERAWLREHLEQLVQERTAALTAEIAQRQRTEEALRESELNHRIVADFTYDWEFWMAPDGRFIYVSPSCQRISGYVPEEFVEAASLLRIVHGEDREHVQVELEQALLHDVQAGFDFRIVTRDGLVRWIEMVYQPVRNAEGQFAGVRGSIRDIMRRKEQEVRVTRLNRVYAVLSGVNTTIVHTRNRKELFESACRIAVEQGKFRLAWIGLLDADGVDVTPVAKAGVDDGYLDNIQLTTRDNTPDRCELVAWALREKTAVVCNNIDTDPRMARWREEALRRGYRSVVVLPLQFADKVSGILLLYASEKDFFDTEEMRLLTEIAGDISFALDHLEANESRLVQSAALNAAANAIVITDRSGSIEWVNRAFTVLTGYPEADVLGRNSRFLKSGKHDPAFYQSLWETILSGQTWRAETTNRRKDGSLYTEHLTIAPVLGESGAIEHFVAIKEDITERLHLQEQLLQAQKMEMVGQLAGGVAHDFNNLLCVILGWTGVLLADMKPDDPIREPLDEIRSAGESASNLTRQLLVFSRQQLVEPAIVNINTVVAETDKMLRRLVSEQIAWDVRLAPDTGNVKIDRGQLEQVLMNLVVNARDAMPMGGTLLIETASVVLDDEHPTAGIGEVPGGEYVMLAVSDTGNGMSEAVRARIFEPFFTTKPRDKGTGLGLATCFGIARQAGGYIAASSEEGVGTTMKVYLPRLRGSVEAGRDHASTPVTHGAEVILLVEDDPSVRRVTVRMLEDQGYRIVSANTGEDALRIIAKTREPFALLLTDVILVGGMTGVVLAERVRALRPELKILFASGYTSDVTTVHGLLESGVALVQKPFTAKELGHKVRQVLDAM